MNGTIVKSLYAITENFASNIDFFLEELRGKKKIQCIIWYHSPNISYRDPNKKEIFINFDLTNTIKSAFKRIPKKLTGDGNWLLIKDECVEEAKRQKITKAFIKDKCDISIQPWRYVFFLKCKDIIDSMIQKYIIIIIRQLYYQLVSIGYIANFYSSHTNLDNSLTDAREIGITDYFVFEDRSRYEIHPNTISINYDPVAYLKDSLLSALEKPEINIWEFQDYYLEMWIEKDALVRLFRDVATKYQLLLLPSRGYTSRTKIQEAIDRFKELSFKGKKCVVLYFGDLDPSRWDIYRNIKERLKDYAKVIRILLNPDQREIYQNLIPMPVKPKDSILSKFKKEHNLNNWYELYAVNPEIILKYSENAIMKFFDSNKIPDTKVWYDTFKKLKSLS